MVKLITPSHFENIKGWIVFKMVPEARLELARLERRGILNTFLMR